VTQTAVASANDVAGETPAVPGAQDPAGLDDPRGAISFYADGSEGSLVWLQRLRDRFRHSVWPDPTPKESWGSAYGRFTLHKIRELFRMEDLTLGGLKREVEYLGRK